MVINGLIKYTFAGKIIVIKALAFGINTVRAIALVGAEVAQVGALRCSRRGGVQASQQPYYTDTHTIRNADSKAAYNRGSACCVSKVVSD